MTSTLLTIAGKVARRTGITVPLTLFPANGNQGDTNDQKLLEALQQTASRLARRDWRVLRGEHTFATVRGHLQPHGLPIDLARGPYGVVNLTRGGQPIPGPITSPEALQFGYQYGWIISGGQLWIHPMPAPGERIMLSYYRAAVATAAPVPRPGLAYPVGSQPTPYGPGAHSVDQPGWHFPGPMFRRRFEADDDIPLWDEELMILGARATFLKNEGFDSASAEADFRTAEYEAFAPEQECIQFGARPVHAPMMRQPHVHVHTELVPYHSDRHFTYAPSTQFHSHSHVSESGGTGPTPAPPRTWNTGATAPTDQENWLGWWPPAQPDGTRPRYVWDGAWVQDL